MAAQTGSLPSDNYTSTQHPHANDIDVFGDQFEEDYADSIHTTISRREDPFRDPTDSTGPTRDYDNDFLHSQSRETTSLQPRHSIRKSSQELSAMRNSTSQNMQPSTQDGGIPNRRLSLVSTSSFAAPQSPMTSGPTGPSHPYAMYPQNFAPSRSASTATARSVQPGPASSIRQGPAHPYNLYPQTVPGESSSSGSQSTVVPIGFPGHAQHFHRRLGPEGEEQDIIGPHGHTEQLPPYSRYPDTYDNKAAAVGLLSATGEASDGERAPHTPLEMQERTPMVEDSHLSDTPNAQTDERNATSAEQLPILSEKLWKDKSWKEKRKTKLWGPLSVGAVLLTALVIVIITVICAGVIGGVLSHRKGGPPPKGNLAGKNQSAASEIVTVTATRYIDATPVSTPTTGGPLPTGTFGVTFADALVSNPSCLVDLAQQAAWSCDFPQYQTNMSINVCFGDSDDQPYMTLSPMYTYLQNPAQVDYGAQPPALSTEPLKPVRDLTNISWGDAYQFQTYYNKLVILHETALIPDADGKVKRYAQGPQSWPGNPGWYGMGKRIQAGDQPWFCWWNNTLVEAFIFVDEDVMQINSSTVMVPVQQLSSSSVPGASSANPYTTSCPTCAPPSATPSSSPQTSAISTPAQTGSAYQQTHPASSQMAVSANVQYTSLATTPSTTSGANTSTVYPRFVKLEERRLTFSGAAYIPGVCTKMSKGSSDRQFTVVTVAGGAPNTIALDEVDPTQQGYARRKRGASTTSASANAQATNTQSCYCEWRNVG